MTLSKPTYRSAFLSLRHSLTLLAATRRPLEHQIARDRASGASRNLYVSRTRARTMVPEGQVMIDLSGKRALVTGASRGIGAAIALALAENGADVAFTYQHSTEKAQK